MRLTPKQLHNFHITVWSHYDQYARSMPWREDHSFYRVLVSEMMLQQTQVSRVVSKFEAFVTRFPDIDILAAARLADVLVMWQGLGYNRRAKYLHDTARYIVRHGIPTTHEGLVALPGIGVNTAGAIMAYAYNDPTVFIETNIRTVFIHQFFRDQVQVHDRDIIMLVEQTLDRDNPREWYWALMDYGSYLKQSNARLQQSIQYRKQAPLRGSNREMRGMLLRALSRSSVEYLELQKSIDDPRFTTALEGLITDGLVERRGSHLCLTGARESS